jgi:hypothetical protein
MAIRNHGITASDVAACEKLFREKGWDMKEAAFMFNFQTDRWEVFRITVASRPKAVADSIGGWDGSDICL